MFDVAHAAVEAALAAGASYADARVIVTRTEGMNARNEVIENVRDAESAGVGVRALLGAGWGFFAVPDLGGRALELAPAPVVDDHWQSTWDEHPLDVPLDDKAMLLLGVTAAMREVREAGIATASYSVWDNEKWFVSSEGSRVSQRIVECGAAMSATAVGDSETQRRSYPGIRGQ